MPDHSVNVSLIRRYLSSAVELYALEMEDYDQRVRRMAARIIKLGRASAAEAAMTDADRVGEAWKLGGIIVWNEFEGRFRTTGGRRFDVCFGEGARVPSIWQLEKLLHATFHSRRFERNTIETHERAAYDHYGS